MVTIMPNLRSVVDHDGAVILDINRDQFFSMNPMGALIWTRLLNGEGLDQIRDALVAETGMDTSVLSADVDDFMADLKSKHLVHFPA
jgi:Coenzyme PQQ synthesis protein D (PqqD)